MVRNTIGGSKTKSLSRKLLNNNNDDVIPTSNDPLEIQVFVSKIFGNGIVQVTNPIDNSTLICHIRGKFRGRNKKNNLISLNSLLIVGLRHWENPHSNCDIIHILPGTFLPTNNYYNDHDDISFTNNTTSTTLQHHTNTNTNTNTNTYQHDIDIDLDLDLDLI
jgi:hypothetical protein